MKTETKEPTAGHTKTPWDTSCRMTQVEVLPEGWNVPICIADCHAKNAPETEAERVANAKFIVTAVNHHAELVEALDRLVNIPEPMTTTEHFDYNSNAIRLARTLLTRLNAK